MTNLKSFTDILDEEIDSSPPFSLSTSSTTNADDQNVVNNINITNKGVNRPAKHTGERQGLRSVEEIDPKYRDVFSFQHFNSVQTKVIEDALYSDKSLVVCAPTGSGKTVIFEMTIVQLLMEMEEKNFDGDFKIIYMAPIKAICTERLTEWYPKFTKLNALCIEVTGDTDVDFSQLKPYRIIITTPEKWDLLTRRWRDYRGMVEVIKLFLIDEVHILNDVTRGPVLEAVVSRMKTIQSSLQSTYRIEQLHKQKQGIINLSQIDANSPKIRFVAASATVSNPEDVAEWLNDTNKPAVFYKFGDECRPVKLKRIVEGYPCPAGTSIFKFDITLNYKLWPIIHRYGDKKPTLIFCNTRKGVTLTAEALSRDITFKFSEEQKAKLTVLASAIKTKKIQSLVLCGIGCHHAGLLFEERVNIERAFRNGDLPILITTTTLAMGVNLPAHLVIIKNTQQYVNGTYQEYSISTVLQMVGRAGRPQFDTEATAVIMTRLTDKARYQALVGGCEPLQSYLHKRLAENLNSEVALGTLIDLAQCVQWVRSTFLFVRAARDPKMYLGLPQSAPTHLISRKIEDMCMKAVNGLERSGLITKDEVCCIQSTEAGRLLSIYYLDLETMKRIMKIKGDESLEQLLWVVCESHELSDMHLRVDERRCLNALNRNNAAVTIRFPMKGKINTRQMKLNCIIQAVLSCLPIHEPSLNQEAIKIMRIANRICKCLLSYVTRSNEWSSPQNYHAVLNAIVLAKCLESQIWENSKYVSKQLKGIGPTYSTLLATAGKINFMLLEESHPRDLERIMNKGPPAGNVLRKQISSLPKYQLTITPIDENSVSIQLKLLNQMHLAENLDHLTAGANHKSYIIIGDSENYLLILASFKDKDLINIYNGEITYQAVRRHNFEHKIMAHCISSNFGGIDVHCEYTFQGLELSHSKVIPISPKDKTDSKHVKQTTITDTFKIRKRQNYDPVETSAVKRKCNFAIIDQIKSFTQSHDKRNFIESEKIEDNEMLHQNSFDVDLFDEKQFFTTNECNKEDDEEINEILNKNDKEILEKGIPNYNVTQKQVPVVSSPFSTLNVGRKTYDPEVKTTKQPQQTTTGTRCFNKIMERDENNFNLIDKIEKEAISTNFSESNEDEQISKILNDIENEILEQDKPNYNITQKQMPVSNPFNTINVETTYNLEAKPAKTGNSCFNKTKENEENNIKSIDEIQKEANFTNFSEILNEIKKRSLVQNKLSYNLTQKHVPVIYESKAKTTETRAKINNKAVKKEKNNFNVIDKIQEKANNMTENDGIIITGEESTFVNITKNHIDEYMKKAEHRGSDIEKNVLKLLEVSRSKSFCENKELLPINDKSDYFYDKNIDDTLNIYEELSILENEKNIEKSTSPQLQKEDQNDTITTKDSKINENKSNDHYNLDELKFSKFKEDDSNYIKPIFNSNTTENNNVMSNPDDDQNISNDFFELQNKHDNTISNFTKIYSKGHENKPTNNNMDYDRIKTSEKSKTIPNLENVQHNTTKDCDLQILEEKELIYKDVETNNEDKSIICVKPDQLNSYNYLELNKVNKIMEIDYSNDYVEPNKALVPIITSNAANNIYQDSKFRPDSTLEKAQKIKDKETPLQPYFNKLLDNTISSGYEYMKKFSFTKTQVNICTKTNKKSNYCVISKVQIDLDIVKNQTTLEKGVFKPVEEELPNILVDNQLNDDQNKTEETRCKNDIVELIPQREQTINIHNNQEKNTIQPESKESSQSSQKLNETYEETRMEQNNSVPETFNSVKDIINKYKKIASSKICEPDTRDRFTPNSTCNKNTTMIKNQKIKRPFRIRDLDNLDEPKHQNTQPPPELDHSKLMKKILESIKDSSETNKHEHVVNESIVEPDIENTRQNSDDSESPDLESSIIDSESPTFDQTELFNDDLDISQSMLNPKSLLESLVQEDIILPPLQFRDEPRLDNSVFDEDLNDLNLRNDCTINLEDAFEKDNTTSAEMKTWALSKEDETRSNICKSITTKRNIPSVPDCYLQSTPSRKSKLNQFKFSRKNIFKVRK